MTGPSEPTASEPIEEPQPPADRERERRRLAEIFGDVLPDSTRDDRELPSPEDLRRDENEDDLLRNVPPHHA